MPDRLQASQRPRSSPQWLCDECDCHIAAQRHHFDAAESIEAKAAAWAAQKELDLVPGELGVVQERVLSGHDWRRRRASLGFVRGSPWDAGGKLYGPIKDSVAAQRAAETASDGDGPLRIERFVKRFADWARWYNTAHRHRMLGGPTPLQAWQEDIAPLWRIGADQLRHLMLAGAERVVEKDGISFRSLTYMCCSVDECLSALVDVCLHTLGLAVC
ncbi:hypothetical protein [Streptomyces sp. TLI_146]|uniref:hypothetical protein n=1 Tax=Streptomyces sp. TLI_146 TaxID=1938858 RepID=UPI000CA8E155|nr:hypothetical protein [Streptomyces sp. TLI_146]PKV82723.1 hypothetical protein BX283_0170 [Streptomyces sp. TLI_146]